MTCMGNRVQYGGKTSTDTASLETIKIHANHVVSSPGAKFCDVSMGNFYVNTFLPEPVFIRIHQKDIPQDIYDEYKLTPNHIDKNGCAMVEVVKAIYGLPQSGQLAHEHLKAHLAKYGYRSMKHTLRLWKHDTCPTTFTVVVNDFGICYFNELDKQHLIDAPKAKYPTKVGNGNKYVGIDFK